MHPDLGVLTVTPNPPPRSVMCDTERGGFFHYKVVAFTHLAVRYTVHE